MANVMTFVMQDKSYKFDMDNVNGREDRDFRKAVGMPVHKAIFSMGQGDIALEAVAGCIWLLRRREEVGLSYDDVLDNLTYADLASLGEEDEEEEVPLGSDSETPGPASATTSA